MTLIILACFGPALYGQGKYGQLDAIWRLQIGLALIPALATLYPRLTMPEGRKFLESRELNRSRRPDSVNSRRSRRSRKSRGECVELVMSDGAGLQEEIDAARAEIEEQGRRPRLDVFFVYFSEWRHLKILLGTAMTWFFMDVAFYGTNLNQSVILEEIGFSKGSNEYDVLKRNTIGNLIIAVAGYVPGYFVTILFIERLGRRWIQIQGFLIAGLMFGIIAGGYNHIGTGGKFVCLAFAQVRQDAFSSSLCRMTDRRQFFFNFGPNATTFIVPAEIFPSRVRGFAHGVSAATGKLGAILSALLFNYLSGPTILGLANVLWIFFACNILGAIITYFLIPETKWKDADVTDYEEWMEANVLGRGHGLKNRDVRWSWLRGRLSGRQVNIS